MLQCLFLSIDHMEIGDELSRRAESVSQDLRFCVVVDGGVSVKDGVDNSGASKEKLRGMYKAWRGLALISEMFTFAASFSNDHGEYKVAARVFAKVCVPKRGR